jgi:phage tail protein X
MAMSDAFTFETYITQEGDAADLIMFKRFGDSSATATFLDTNPGLAERGPKLPAGLTLRIPVPVQKDRKQSTRLWS